MKRLRVAIPTLLVLATTGFAAEAYKWADNSSSAANWRDASKWTDAAGQPVAAAPWNDASQSVQFGPLADPNKSQAVSVDARETKPSDFTWAEVAMPALSETGFSSRRTINLSTTATTTVGEYGAWLTLQDILAPDFLWTFAHGEFGFRLPSTADKTLALSHVSTAKRVDVSVPTAGTKATVETVRDGGPLVKRGAGELEVKGTSGSDVFIHVADGTLTLDGQVASDAGDDVPVPGAWMHLDADREDTMKWYAADDGRTYVTNWADVRGNGAFAYYNAAWKRAASQTHLTDTTHAPFINKTLVSGRSVMDFGRAKPTQDESLGPIACVLTLSQTRSDVREVFCSMGLTYRADGAELYDVPVFSSDVYPFLPTRDKIVADNNARTHAAANGDILVDGARTSNGVGWPKSFGVVSIGLTNGVEISSLANDRMYNERVGGIRIGEILIYTNVLTHAQRLAVHRYLQRKWTKQGDLENLTAGAMTLATSATTVSVPAGRTAIVGEVTAVGGNLIKTGDGELKVGSLVGKMGAKGAAVDVRGGSVSFGGLEPVDTDRPADGAYLWLDADKNASFEYDDESSAMVSVWKDCRDSQTDIAAHKPTDCKDYVAGGKLPVRVANATGEHSAVDFGAYTASNQGSAFMEIGTVSSAKIYEAFIVQSYTDPSYTVANVFGSSSGVALKKDSSTRLLRPDYGNYVTRSALWTVNGAVTDPLLDGAVDFKAGEFNVVSVSATEKMYIDLLGAKERLGQNQKWGGVQIGEFIIYDRQLTPAERRQTIAYLMKRWRGVTVPYAKEATTQVGSLAFADDAAAEINADSDLEVGRIDGSDGTIVKDGAGTVAVEDPIYGKLVGSISVNGGRLELEGGSPLASILAKTAFHFDASDLGSLSYSVDGDVTNVSAIADQRVSGLSAKTWTNPTSTKTDPISFTDPTLKTIETASGVFRPVLDFGDQNSNGAYTRWATNYNAAAMLFSTTFDDICEVHTLFADSDKDDRRNVTIVSDDSNYHYLRGGNGTLLSTNARTETVRNGYLAVDCQESAYSDEYPSGLHLFSAVPTGATSVGQIGADRNITAGGCQVGELLGFKTALTETERGLLQSYLMAKWFAAPMPPWTNDVAAATVAGGATLAFGANDSIRFSSLGGEGTIEALTVLVNGTLTLTADKPLSVVGKFVQEGPLSVDLGTIGRKVPAGDYPVLQATDYDGLDLSAWNIVSDLPHNRDFSFVLKDGAVCLHVTKHGFSFIVR